MRTSVIARMGLMAVLVCGLAVALLLLSGLVSERAGRRAAATAEVGEQWGGDQLIIGPVLSVDIAGTVNGANGKPVPASERLCVLPRSLTITSEVTPEIRRRGLFEVIVYRTSLKLTGVFGPPELAPWRARINDMAITASAVSIALSDPRGISGGISLEWDGVAQRFVPGTPDLALVWPGISGSAPLPAGGRDIPFSIELNVNGTGGLRFVPTGNDTTVRMTSSWPHPSFIGAPLPRDREVTKSGFTAVWDVPYYGRSFSPAWTLSAVSREHFKEAVAKAAFGVALIRPVDIYQQSERAVKYAVLFIIMTFVIAFLWEVLNGAPVHPVQYLFLGFAMALFYLLLLALSEHVGFDKAYAIAAASNVVLIAWYWNWVIRQGLRHGLMMGTVLVTLYGYLYLLLRLEDYALVAGALGLFVMLAAIMFLTRRIDWYTLTMGGKESANQP